MALPSSPDAYPHIQTVFDAVIGRPGATYTCTNSKAATRWRAEAYYFRKLVQAQGNRSYDDLVLKLSGSTITFARREADGELRDAAGKPLSLASSRAISEEEIALEASIFELAGKLNLDVADD